MRDRVNVLYYPDMVADELTLKKAILFFDELHFMDRPSFSFDGGLGTIGMASPLRQFEQLFRRDGVPFFVHTAPGGRVNGELQGQIAADINDPDFRLQFQRGLQRSRSFRDGHIQHGKYGDPSTGNAVATHEDVAASLIAVDISTALRSYPSAMALLTDPAIRPFALSDPVSCARTLIFLAAECSAKMNVALTLGNRHGFVPLADAYPYGDLLATKYVRAIRRLDPEARLLPVTDLAFAIFDELVPSERLLQMTIPDVIRYRRDAASAREAFLEYLSALQTKQGIMAVDANYADFVADLIKTEILPAAHEFRNQMKTIGENLFGSIVKGAIGAAGGAGGVQVFGDLSLERLLALASLGAAYVGNAAIDALLTQRKVRRECSLSYVLSMDD